MSVCCTTLTVALVTRTTAGTDWANAGGETGLLERLDPDMDASKMYTQSDPQSGLSASPIRWK